MIDGQTVKGLPLLFQYCYSKILLRRKTWKCKPLLAINSFIYHIHS